MENDNVVEQEVNAVGNPAQVNDSSTQLVNNSGQIVDNKIYYKKKKNSKLRDWYIKHFNVNKEDDKLRKANATRLDIENVVGTVLVSFWASYLLPIVPFAARFAKKSRLWVYDKVKEGIDRSVGLDIKDEKTDDTGYLDEETLAAVENITTGIVSTKMSGESLRRGRTL